MLQSENSVLAHCELISVHKSQFITLKAFLWTQCWSHNGRLLKLFLWLGAAALWWLSTGNCTLLSGATMNSSLFLAPTSVCFTDISIPVLSSELCGLTAITRLGFSFLGKLLWCCFFLLCLLCLIKLMDIDRRSKLGRLTVLILKD